MSNEKGKGRTRNFACVVYEESAPENWRDILTEQFVPAFISPLHDSDFNPGGEIKKPHYHVILMFDGVKTIEQAKEVLLSIGGIGCEVVKSIRGYARYLCHLDNPEKFRYEISDVVALCGADYDSTISLPSDIYEVIGEMMDYCDRENIISYADLLRYSRLHKPDWFRCLCKSATYVMKEFIKTRTWETVAPEDPEEEF